MPFVQVNLPAGSADLERKREIVEVTDGGWGIADRAYTLAEIQAATGSHAQ